MRTRVQNTNIDGGLSKYGTIQEEGYTYGSLLRGIVKDNNDPLGMGRVKVYLPNITPDNVEDYPWASVLQFGAGNGSGTMITPAVGTMVFVAFENGDSSCPIVVGSVYCNSVNRASGTYNTAGSQLKNSIATSKYRVLGRQDIPEEGMDINHTVIYKSTSGSVIYMNDSQADEDVVIKGSSGESITLSTDDITFQSGSTELIVGNNILINNGDTRATVASDLISLDSNNVNITADKVRLKPEYLEISSKDDINLKSGDTSIVIGESITLKNGDSEVIVDSKGVHVLSKGCSFNIFNGKVDIESSSINLMAPVIHLGDDV